MSSKFPPLIVCVGCGAQKGEVNHWFLLSTHNAAVFRGTASADAADAYLGQRRRLEITDFAMDGAEDPDRHPVCGAECALKFVSNWLTEPVAVEK